MSFLNAILVAVAVFALLAVLGILFGILEHTTDKEFKTLRFFRDSYRRLPARKRSLIFALAAVMSLIYLSSTQLVSVVWLNWTLLIVAVGIEAVCFAWTFRVSDRIRELAIGAALLLAAWPVFGSLCVNLSAYGGTGEIPLVATRVFVVACALALAAIVFYRIYTTLNPNDRPRLKVEDFIPKEEKTHEV